MGHVPEQRQMVDLKPWKIPACTASKQEYDSANTLATVAQRHWLSLSRCLESVCCQSSIDAMLANRFAHHGVENDLGASSGWRSRSRSYRSLACATSTDGRLPSSLLGGGGGGEDIVFSVCPRSPSGASLSPDGFPRKKNRVATGWFPFPPSHTLPPAMPSDVS